MKTTLPRPGVLGLIGNTPLIRLGFASEETGCEILAKAEFMNPGGSIKDRTAAFLLNDAIARGHVARGGRVVEGTGGNTGIGLAMVGAALGVATTIFMAETQTPEKQRSLRMLGVDLRLTPAVPFANPLNYVRQAEAFAASEKAAGRDVHYLNQWDNPANHEGHRDTTAPELWAQVDGRLDGFVMAVGTGGTLAGFSEFLKAKAPNCVVAAADPPGASVYHWVNDGRMEASAGSSIAEGIGQGRLTGNLAAAQIDTAFRIEDHESLSLVWRLLAEEGLAIGHSSAVNVAGAIQLAKRLGPGHRIATILCDGLGRYESKLGDVARLQSLGLPPPPWLVDRASA